MQDLWGNSPCFCRAPLTPIEILCVVRKNGAANLSHANHGNFKRISLRLTCNRTNHGETCFHVVSTRRDHQSRSPARLLSSSLWCKVQPNQIPSLRRIPCLQFRSRSYRLRNANRQAIPIWIPAFSLAILCRYKVHTTLGTRKASHSHWLQLIVFAGLVTLPRPR